MKKRTKGLVMFVFLGGLMVTSGVLIAVPGTIPDDLQPVSDTVTGTPADNFPDAQRPQFCSTGDPMSTRYVTEYEIPTACTQPLAIKVDSQGIVWFAQTNTGNVASFDPKSETFEEFENPAWPESGRSMIWGMDYSPDGSMWYTDEAYDAIWRFDTISKEYSRISYSNDDAFPQRIQVTGSSVVINDFANAKISFIEQTVQKGESTQFVNIPSPLAGSYTSDFALDGDYVWYTNWVFGAQGALVRFDHAAYQMDAKINPPLDDYIMVTDLPENYGTPNGITVGPQGYVWIADTSSSSLYRFDKQTETFDEFITSKPPISTYGNATGLVLDPISRPYWLESSDDIIVFNEQTGNRIAVLYPLESRLVEYQIPSTNPNWADCGISLNCGLSQSFGFDVYEQSVWFTEWVENNIAVLDLSKDLPIQMDIENKNLEIKNGASDNILVRLTPTQSTFEVVKFSSNSPVDGITTSVTKDTIPVETPMSIDVTITVDDTVPSGQYKILVGFNAGDVAISEYVDVIV